jgi:hypothetical protein
MSELNLFPHSMLIGCAIAGAAADDALKDFEVAWCICVGRATQPLARLRRKMSTSFTPLR